MSVADTLKGLVFKKPAQDPRRGDERIEGGRRAGETENPYLSARRSWNDHVGAQVASRRMWQIAALMAFMVVLAAIGGIIQIGSQSKFIPYVVEVDKLGQHAVAGVVQSASKADPRVIKASVAEFISDARLVTPDVSVQRKAIFRIYAKLAHNDPATQKMSEWLNGDEEKNPFQRATKEMVSIEIASALPQSQDTWQIDWEETIRDRQGVVTGIINMRALVTTYLSKSTQETEDNMRRNPLGIFVRDFSWSQLL
ncbi:MAG: conjugal transfer protein TrbF [Candidatus Thiodiazotropha sp. (ex Dulcina madagascariensis)]|nr:conjugal transfer protein TrbF [Candidatus Thiodiazotropha sp. (ex Dulcina madagascariensis)]